MTFSEKTWELSSNKIMLHVILLRFASNGLKKKTLKSCLGPPSPDQYFIENLWSWLDHNLGKIKIKDLDQLKEEVTKLLNNVPKDITQNLVNSMPKRINECLKAKGL